MMKLAALAPLAAAASALPAAPEENAGAGAALFPESRLITPAHGALLNSWAKKPAEQTWKLCYTTFTMSKTSPAEFHKSCDQYKPTVTVVHNMGGRPGRCRGMWNYQDGMDVHSPCTPIGSTCQDPGGGPPGPKCPDGGHGKGTCVGQCSFDGSGCPVAGPSCGPTNAGNFTFGGYADATWSGDRVPKGTSACFIFGLGPNEPVHYGISGQWASTSDWPAWPANGWTGLWIGGTPQMHPTGAGGPPGAYGSCTAHPALCGGNGNWGETELEVWRPVCRTAADCDAHQSCDVDDGSCRCESGWSGPDCGTCDKKHFCSGRGSCVLPSSGNTPPCHCDAGYSGADCSTIVGSPMFPGTRIISPTWGTALDEMMQHPTRDGPVVPAGQVWKLCYSSDTMNRTVAEFHARCDPHNITLSVAHNSLGRGTSGTLGRPDSLVGVTFGGFADESWSQNSGCHEMYDKACYKGTPACFIFGLGTGDKKPQYNPIQGTGYNARHDPDTARYSSNYDRLNQTKNTDFIFARTTNWPQWGYGTNPDLSMGYKGPPGHVADCETNARGGGTYAGAPDEPSGVQGPPICGSISLGVWGGTQLEVWRMATAEELDAAALLPSAPLPPTGPYNASCVQCGCVGAFQWDLQCNCLNLERQRHETVLKQACNLSGQYACKPGSINNQDGTLVCQRKTTLDSDSNAEADLYVAV